MIRVDNSVDYGTGGQDSGFSSVCLVVDTVSASVKRHHLIYGLIKKERVIKLKRRRWVVLEGSTGGSNGGRGEGW